MDTTLKNIERLLRGEPAPSGTVPDGSRAGVQTAVAAAKYGKFVGV
jgi:hypothetical protein